MTSRAPSLVVLAAIGAAASGAVIALQGRVNGDLATAGAGVLVAGWLSYVGTLAATALVVLARRRTRVVAGLIRRRARWWWFAVGLCGIPIVLAMAGGIPLVGVAIASVCAVAGQTLAGLALDARGVGVPAAIRLSGRRLLAGLVALVGLGIAVLGSSGGDVTVAQGVAVGVALFVAGAVLCIQQAGNGRVVAATADPVLAGLTSSAGGTVGITVILAVAGSAGGLDGVTFPPQWWLYAGGPLGAVITIAAAWAVRHLGTFVLTLTVISGQMLTALLLDLLSAGGLRLTAVLATIAVASSAVLVVERRRATTAAADDALGPVA
ncbi:DMT family transporter [Serinibacter arcticus]|uniref:Putative inner membrane protein n=1 Tax=Serinibacter arcticus TaxID=1655435 RepID=A0A4Z1EAY6_9MICO|nr:DMT family transporter [Serinibacter arcticus]TGO06627.1 putative inner membrane protein [Serinibacter arcticus]